MNLDGTSTYTHMTVCPSELDNAWRLRTSLVPRLPNFIRRPQLHFAWPPNESEKPGNEGNYVHVHVYATSLFWFLLPAVHAQRTHS